MAGQSIELKQLCPVCGEGKLTLHLYDDGCDLITCRSCYETINRSGIVQGNSWLVSTDSWSDERKNELCEYIERLSRYRGRIAIDVRFVPDRRLSIG